MVDLTALWLPILLSAVFVFVVSSILHMVLPIHKSDYRKLPGEDAVMAAMREQRVTPGHYVFPHCGSMQEMGTPEMVEKLKIGPVGFLTVVPGFQMGKSLVLWFLYSLVISLFAGYIGRLGLPTGMEHEYMKIFQITGTAAVLGYAFSSVSDSIWKGLSWSITAKFVFDGLLYGLVTAGTFAWLWPGRV